MQLVKDGKAKLYKIWESDPNDRSHFGNVISDDWDKVIKWMKNNFIKPEYQDRAETINIGICISTCNPDDCWENVEKGEYEDKEEMCGECDNSQSLYITAEEIKTVDISDFDYKTIFGTNEFYDLTGNEPTKKDDFDPALSSAWRHSPKVGMAALLLSPLTPQSALSPELKKKSKEELEKAGLKKDPDKIN